MSDWPGGSDKIVKKIEDPFWQALRDRTFLLGTTAALLGYFAFLVTWFLSSVLMTQLTRDPGLIALVNAAVQAPLLFVILPAAAVARLIDRRILLIAVNLAISCMLFCMASESTSLHPTPIQVLVLTFSLGTLATFSMSVWQISGPDVVAKSMVPGATITVSAGFNLTRAVAPIFGAASLNLLGAQVTLISGAVLALIGAFPPDRVEVAQRSGASIAIGICRSRLAKETQKGFVASPGVPNLHCVAVRELGMGLTACYGAAALW